MARFKDAVKAGVERLPLGVAGLIWSLAGLRCQNSRLRSERRSQVKLHRALGSPTKIIAGPFRGLSYLRCSSGSAWLPKLLGTYELELAPTIEELCSRQFDLIV